MLSRVAERIYWAARYLERVENTARLVSVYANLLLDLPRGVNIDWYNLVIINGGTAEFEERFKNQDERNVVKFLLADETNSSSMLSSLNMMRENIRTTRDVVPADTWELVNELFIFVKDHMQQAVNRSGRHDFLDEIINGCQQINGLLSGTMSQDAAWEFLRLGRNLERADMTTRILDAGSAALIHAEMKDGINLPQIIWGNVLRSVSADQAYRRTVRGPVTGRDVATFLLEDEYFPRTVVFCLDHMLDSVSKLPQNEALHKQFVNAQRKVINVVDYSDLGEPFRDYINDLQLLIANLHKSIVDNWFSIG